MEKFNAAIPMRYALLTFSTVLTIGFMKYFFYQSIMPNMFLMGMLGFISLAMALFLAIWSGITYRREAGGVISFAHAFLAVYLVFASYAIANILPVVMVNKVIDKDYPHKVSKLMTEKMAISYQKKDMTDDEIKKELENFTEDKYNPSYSDLANALISLLIITGIVSVMIALFIKRGSSDLISSGSPPGPISTI